MNSIAAGFYPDWTLANFVGWWEELEGWPFDHLSDGVRVIRSCFHKAGPTL